MQRASPDFFFSFRQRRSSNDAAPRRRRLKIEVEGFVRNAVEFAAADDEDCARVDEGHAVLRRRRRQLGRRQGPSGWGQTCDGFLHDACNELSCGENAQNIIPSILFLFLPLIKGKSKEK